MPPCDHIFATGYFTFQKDESDCNAIDLKTKSLIYKVVYVLDLMESQESDWQVHL